MKRTLPLESSIQHDILDLLRKKRCVAVKVPSGGIQSDKRGFIRMAAAGTADILACCDGVAVACEVKRPGGVPTEAQKQFLEAWEFAGGKAFVAHSVGEVMDEMEWN